MRSNTITLELSPNQVENLAEKLPLRNKIHLAHKLAKETTWQERLDTVTTRMRASVKKARVSTKSIDRICEEVKKEYDEKHRRH